MPILLALLAAGPAFADSPASTTTVAESTGTWDETSASSATPAAVMAFSTGAVVATPTTPVLESTADVIVLTLSQCVHIGLAHATDVLKAANDVQFTGTQLLQAYLQFLPSIDASAGYGWQSGRDYLTLGAPSFVSTTNRWAQYQLAGDFNVFNGLSDYAALRSGRQKKTSAELTLYRAKQQIALDITQAYLQVLLDRRIVTYGLTNVQASQAREALLQEQTRVGVKSLADLYRQQAQTSSDQLFLINARNRAHDDLILLLRRLRVDLARRYDILDVPLNEPPAANPYARADALVRQALHNRPDLAAAQSTAQAAQWDVATARGGYYPRLDLTADMNGGGRWLNRQTVGGVDVAPASQPTLGHQLGSEIIYDAGAVLTWGLFDRYITRLAVARQTEAARNSDIDYEDRLLQVEGDVQTVMGDYDASLQQVDAADKGIQAAKEAYDAVQTRYTVGASSIVDLLIAQSALLQAQASDAQARIGYVLQDKTMQFVLGAIPVQ
ncbi:MAG TPA: TolC family protein [Elusimicrobiota bacterium]|nr:TolC family protein [Elusimicrobiota bacterium]